MEKQQQARLTQRMNTVMPRVLDGITAMLLSYSANLISEVAGATALALSVAYMNYRIYGGR